MRLTFTIVLSIILSFSAFSQRTVEVVDFEGFKPYLEKQDGKVYVINFWATWCKPCIKELPAFQKLHDSYGDKGLEVLLVSLDMPRQLDSRLIPYLEAKNITPEVILLDDPDANAWINKVDPKWSGAIPATLIYKNGIRGFYERSFTYEQLEEIVKSKYL